MWIDRDVEPLLLQRAETRPVVVLTGARQTGKTSLMHRLFPDGAGDVQAAPLAMLAGIGGWT